MKLHNVIREDIFNFVKRKFGSVNNSAEVKQTSYKEIEEKITDESTLAAFRDEQAAYEARESEFKAEAEAAKLRLE